MCKGIVEILMNYFEDEIHYWQNEISIELGIPKEQALDIFMGWRETRKTCQRCECDEYLQYCNVKLICEECNERDAKGDDNGTGIIKVDEPKTLRVGLSQARKRASIR